MVSQHVFRHPDLVQQLPFRDYMRTHCPGAKDGLSVLDLDLVLLQFGPLIGRDKDADGKFALVEIKHQKAKLNYAQGRLMCLMHKLLRQADPQHHHYIGSFLLHWDGESNRPEALNHKPITECEFVEWASGRVNWPSLYD